MSACTILRRLPFNASTPLCGRTDLQLVDLQPLGANLCLRWRHGNWLLAGSIGDWFNHPLPTEMPIFVESPSCATAFPDLHSPVMIVGRNCEYQRNRGRDHHSAQHSNQKYSFHSQLPHSFILLSFTVARAVDFAVPLPSYTVLPLLDQCFCPHFTYLRFESRRQAGSF